MESLVGLLGSIGVARTALDILLPSSQSSLSQDSRLGGEMLRVCLTICRFGNDITDIFRNG